MAMRADRSAAGSDWTAANLARFVALAATLADSASATHRHFAQQSVLGRQMALIADKQDTR